MKPIKDPKIKNIINDNKDFKMSLNSEEILTKFKSLSENKVVNKEIIKEKRNIFKPLIFSLPLVCATCLAIIIPLSLNNKNEQITINNSSNLEFLNNKDNQLLIGKQFALFGLNSSEDNTQKKSINYKISYQNEEALNYQNIISKGFKRMIPLFLNNLVDFNNIDTQIKDAKFKVYGENNVLLDKVLISNYILHPYLYYFSSNNDSSYGILKDFTFTTSYKVNINEISLNKESSLKINIQDEKTNTYFKISNDFNNKDLFTFDIFNDLNSFNKDNFDLKNNISLKENDSYFTLEKNNNYFIDYRDFSLFDLIFNFNVKFNDYLNQKILDFSCSFNKSNNEIVIK